MSDFKLLNGPKIEPASKTIKNIVLFLHGYGANGSDLINIASEWIDILPNTIFYSPNAPFICDINPEGFQWFKLIERTEEELQKGLQQCGPPLNSFIDHILEKHQLKMKDLLIVGFSQGTIISLYHLIRRKLPCAGIIGFSGLYFEGKGLDVDISFPILLYHGKDDQVIECESSKKAEKLLSEKGFNVDCHLQENLGHGIDINGLNVAKEFIKKIFKV